MGKKTIAQLEAELATSMRLLHEAEQREASLGMLIDFYAGLGTSTWANLEHGEYLDVARAGFKAKQAEREATPASRRAVRSNVVHEFDPAVPGDYVRAMRACREHGGSVRRVSA